MEGALALAVIALFFLVARALEKTRRLTTQLSVLNAEVSNLRSAVTRLEEAPAGAPVPVAAPVHPPPAAPPASRQDLICSRCGTGNPPGSTTCQGCGRQVADAAPSPSTGLQPRKQRPAPAEAAVVAAPAARQAPAPSSLERSVDKLRTTEEWEALIGGRWLNRIGALALILGVGFFLKYAVDQNWISQSMRVGMGLVLGFGLLLLARQSHGKGYAIFAQGLVGAGLSTLYLSIFASFNFYHLVPQPAALTAMALVTALAFAQALYYDSLAVSLLGLVGGFLTPFLLSAGESSPLGTLIYVALLDAGILGILARKRSWFVLEPLALGATYVTYFSWFLGSYSSGRLVLAAVGVTLLWSLFFAYDLYGVLRTATPSAWLRHALGMLNGVSYYTALFWLIYPHHHAAAALATLAVGSVYAGAVLTARRAGRLTPGVGARYSLTALTLLVIATAVGFSGYTVVILWSLEALPVLWLGARWKLAYLWAPALGVYALAAGLLFTTYGMNEPLRSAIDQATLACLVLAGVLAVSTVPFRRLDDPAAAWVWTWLHYAWCALLFLLLTAETNDYYRQLMAGASPQTATSLDFQRYLALAAVWMAYSLPLVWFGWRTWSALPVLDKAARSREGSNVGAFPWSARPIALSGFGSAALAVGLGMGAGAAYRPLERFHLLLNPRAAVLLLLIAGLAVHLWWLARQPALGSWVGRLQTGGQAAALAAGFELLTVEVSDYYMHRFGHPLFAMSVADAFVECSVLAAVWMAYSLPLVRYGARRTSTTVLTCGLVAAGCAVLVGAVAGVALQPSKDFTLMLRTRPALLAFLTAFALQLRWLRQSRELTARLDKGLVIFHAAIVLLGFGLISAETRDLFAQQIARTTSSHRADDLRNLRQLALSVVWLLYAILLMGLGIWRRIRWLRFGAIALFGFIILKVFAYDLSFLQGPYRSASFAGLGLILLGVSFLYQRYRGLLLDG